MPDVPESVLYIIEKFNKANFQAFAVGGCIRDRMLGIDPKDWDVCSSATPEEALRVFADDRIIPTGIKHGTVTVIARGEPIEVTTFRTDGEYSDSRHPDKVIFVGDLISDLKRRDFTINAMAWSPESGLIDPFGGKEDLSERCIRCVGDPEIRFREDVLRVIRGLRFSSSLGFSIEENTAQALRNAAEMLALLPGERIFPELLGLLSGAGVKRALLDFPEVIAAIIPELRPAFGFRQNAATHIWDVWRHTVESVAAVPPDPLLRLTMLLHDVAKPETCSADQAGTPHFYGHQQAGAQIAAAILERLRAPGVYRDTVPRLIAMHNKLLPDNQKGMRRLLADIGPGLTWQLIAVKRADAQAHAPKARDDRIELIERAQAVLKALLEEGSCFSVKDLKLGGEEIASLGVPKGPRIGRVLKLLLDAVIDEQIENDRDKLVKYAQELINTDQL